MSPEAPGNLVVLDLRSEQGGFVCHVERYDPVDPNALVFLRVSWNAVTRPSGYEPVAGGAVYVEMPAGFEHREYDAAPDVVGERLGWIDKVFGDGLMLVVRLPYGFGVMGFRDAEPGPMAAKVHDGRMVLYWLLPTRTRVTWRQERVDPERVPALCGAITNDAAQRDRQPAHPVEFSNPPAARDYPAGVTPDDDLVGFHELCAWIGEKGGDDAQVSFTGILLTFLAASDPVSRWFSDYVARRGIAIDEILQSKGFKSIDEVRKLAAAYVRADRTMRKPPWTPSAREVLTSSDALAKRVGGEGAPMSIRHVMGAYCHFHYPNHDAQLRRWGFDLSDWLSEYRKCLESLDVTPVERAGWFRLFRELGLPEPAQTARTPEPMVDNQPARWDIFIAHAGPDKAIAEQLCDRLEEGGHRVYLDARRLQPGDFWDRELPRALATSQVVAVLVSANYDAAQYLRGEVARAINSARHTGRPRVVPVYLNGLPPDGESVPYGLENIQSIDARMVGGLSAVASRIGALLQRPA